MSLTRNSVRAVAIAIPAAAILAAALLLLSPASSEPQEGRRSAGEPVDGEGRRLA